MHLTREQLKDVVVNVVRQHYGTDLVERHFIIEAVEKQVRQDGAWEASDDDPSRSTDPKSKGRALIDWAISALKKDGRLENPARNMWRAPGVA